MLNNKYKIAIFKLKQLLLSHSAITPIEKRFKALNMLTKIRLSTANRRVLSPYLPLLKRYQQLLQLSELSHILEKKPEDSQRIFAIIISYAEGNLVLPNALLQIRSPYNNNCPICFDTIKLNSTHCPGNQCFNIFCVDCLEKWLSSKHTCPLCRAVDPLKEDNVPASTTASSFRTYWNADSGGFGY